MAQSGIHTQHPHTVGHRATPIARGGGLTSILAVVALLLGAQLCTAASNVPQTRIDRLKRGVNLSGWWGQISREQANTTGGPNNTGDVENKVTDATDDNYTQSSVAHRDGLLDPLNELELHLDGFIDEADLANIRAAGFTHVRLAIDPDRFTDVQNVDKWIGNNPMGPQTTVTDPYADDNGFFKGKYPLLISTIQKIIDADLAVIIDLHPTGPGENQDLDGDGIAPPLFKESLAFGGSGGTTNKLNIPLRDNYIQMWGILADRLANGYNLSHIDDIPGEEDPNNLGQFFPDYNYSHPAFPAEMVYFEVMNEPGSDISRPDWNTLQQMVVQEIRGKTTDFTGSNAFTIIVAGDQFQEIKDLTAFTSVTMPTDTEDNLVYNFHFYEPKEITHGGLLGFSDKGIEYLIGLDYPEDPAGCCTTLVNIMNDLKNIDSPPFNNFDAGTSGVGFQFPEPPNNTISLSDLTGLATAEGTGKALKVSGLDPVSPATFTGFFVGGFGACINGCAADLDLSSADYVQVLAKALDDTPGRDTPPGLSLEFQDAGNRIVRTQIASLAFSDGWAPVSFPKYKFQYIGIQGPPPNFAQPSNPVPWVDWSFDEHMSPDYPTTDSFAHDASVKQQHGKLMGGAALTRDMATPVLPEGTGVLDLTATGPLNRVVLETKEDNPGNPSFPSMAITSASELTVSFWIKTTQANGVIVDYCDPTSGTSLFKVSNPGALKLEGINLSFTITTQSVNDGTWHHLTITYDLVNGPVKIYVDANPPLSTLLGSGSPINGGGELILGEDGAGIDPAFDGYMDDFKLYVDHPDPSNQANTVSGIVTPDLIPVTIVRPILNWTFDLDENDPNKAPVNKNITDGSGNNNAGFATIGTLTVGDGAKLAPGPNGHGMAIDLTMPDPQGQVNQFDPGGATFNGVFRSPVNGLANDEITVAFWVKTTDLNGAIFSYAADPSTVVFFKCCRKSKCSIPSRRRKSSPTCPRISPRSAAGFSTATPANAPPAPTSCACWARPQTTGRSRVNGVRCLERPRSFSDARGTWPPSSRPSGKPVEGRPWWCISTAPRAWGRAPWRSSSSGRCRTIRPRLWCSREGATNGSRCPTRPSTH